MARSRSARPVGRPKKWGDAPTTHVQVETPTDLADRFKAAAEAANLNLSDFLIVVGCKAVGEPVPDVIARRLRQAAVIQEALPLSA
jgi:hypothetical protein